MPGPDVDDGAAPRVVVAIDGPGGSGKSSVSRGAAARLGLAYLDTGAMYRALTWWLLREGVDVDDAAAVAAQAARPSVESGTDPAAPTIRCAGVDVAGPIRGADVTAAVSAVSAVPEVRARLVALQREAVRAALADGRGIVVEGRDIGSVVLPDADVKVYLDADPAERARRRALEEAVRAGSADPAADAAAAAEEVRRSLARRDAHDSARDASPMQRASDAVVVDATALTLDEVIERVVGLVREADARDGGSP